MKSVKPILLSLSLSALLVACGDGGSGGNDPVGARRVATVEDAGPCNAKNDEETVLVGEEHDPWWCDASTGTWTRLNGDDGDSSGSLSSDDDESSSSGKSGGKSSKKSSSSSSSSSSSYKEVFFDCTGKTARSGKQNMTVMVDTLRRSFVMNIPATYDGTKAVPLIVDYHGPGGSGSNAYALDTTYRPLTEAEGVITLYPDASRGSGSGSMSSMPNWNVGPCCSDKDDTLFTRIMIDSVKAHACIDTTRIYAKSFSYAGMAHHVACFMSEIFAAVAPAASDLNKTNSAQCRPTRPISVIMFRGKMDGVVRYEGKDSGYNDGMNFLGAERNFLFWAEKNGCTGSPTTNADGCREYSSCEGGAKVVLCADEHGGHEPGDGAIGWPFLKQFRLP